MRVVPSMLIPEPESDVRVPVQIATGGSNNKWVIVLADDGTLWRIWMDTWTDSIDKWEQIPNLPKREQT
jgi:hypothetical protein